MSEEIPFQANPGTPTKGICTICKTAVEAKISKAGGYYLVNQIDGSYHRAFGKQYGTNICVKNKAEYEWQQTHKDDLAGYTVPSIPANGLPPSSGAYAAAVSSANNIPPSSGAAPSRQAAPPVRIQQYTGPMTAMEEEAVNNCDRFFSVMYPKAMNLALESGAKDLYEQNVRAGGFLHDFAKIWSASMVIIAHRSTYNKASELGTGVEVPS